MGRKVSEKFKDNYTTVNKDLTHCHQILFRNEDDSKFLSFTFYPTKNKLLVQGSHADLLTWINVFRELDNNPAP